MEDKKHKRTVKTPFQVEALEKFYNEHTYPSESMKIQLAESIGLTEKQVSGWFCHRRLKDRKSLNGEACAPGRQDRSSGVIQDRGSGLRQDSCGSTKQEDYKQCDPKEVESRRFTSKDFSTADPNYELGSHYTENNSGNDDTSSGSSSPLQDSFPPQNADPFGLVKSRNITQTGNSLPINVKGVKGRTGPSGFLKVKGQIENSAITTVKRQLGRHYREDGPPLGVEFEPLPPDAFESSIQVPVNQPHYVGEPILPHSSDGSRICKQPNHTSRYEGYSSKTRSHNSDLDETSFKTIRGSNHHKIYSSMEMNEVSARETPVYNSRDNYGIKAKHGVGHMRTDYVSSHHLHPYGGEVVTKQTESQLRNYDSVGPMVAHRESFESKPSSSTLKHSEFLGLEHRGPSRRIAKSDVQEGEFYGGRREINENHDPVRVKINSSNEIRVAKRERDENPQQQYLRKASTGEMSQLRRSAAEIPSSFSEDETAETSSSGD